MAMIDVEQQQLTKRLVELAEENNKLLRKLHHSLMFGRVFRILYWVIIIGIGFGALYFLQPYIDSVQNLYNNVINAQKDLGGVSNVIFGQDLPSINKDSGVGVQE